MARPKDVPNSMASIVLKNELRPPSADNPDSTDLLRKSWSMVNSLMASCKVKPKLPMFGSLARLVSGFGRVCTTDAIK